MTTEETRATGPTAATDSLTSPREWLQTQHGDWILPSLNARHFGTGDGTTALDTAQADI